MKPSEIFEVEPKKDEMCITYASDTNSVDRHSADNQCSAHQPSVGRYIDQDICR